MASSLKLLTTTGSSYGLMDANLYFTFTGRYHMCVSGTQQSLDYGDHGPNEYSATARSSSSPRLNTRNPNMPSSNVIHRTPPNLGACPSMTRPYPERTGRALHSTITSRILLIARLLCIELDRHQRLVRGQESRPTHRARQ
ncbi:hypothetical protein M407DRAFT_101202 [Tulasnella calospora MUT 4182]|uniref:Uncharacterized protein n=1 Tax=Tulasnella calospora MUT 4182 TaxID=1051891 RepID=A0A0C3LSS9_9AGAM|nr:hypothetical protein M407DRAFT_101202 [Tulasnella calospora MUT 4182]